MRFMGLDVGDSTIGVAISDELFLTAQGIETIRRKDIATDLQRIESLQKEYSGERFILGYPKNMNGTEGVRCTLVKEFASILQEHFPSIEIFFQDERLSTKEAERRLIFADVSRKKRKKVIDKMAAVIILQSYLDALPR